uniref:Histone acetyltransferase n=1 Tax=Mesocestoides corti TaxID=53468 RepID=A0A5K3FA81_MESCO
MPRATRSGNTPKDKTPASKKSSPGTGKPQTRKSTRSTKEPSASTPTSPEVKPTRSLRKRTTPPQEETSLAPPEAKDVPKRRRVCGSSPSTKSQPTSSTQTPSPAKVATVPSRKRKGGSKESTSDTSKTPASKRAKITPPESEQSETKQSGESKTPSEQEIPPASVVESPPLKAPSLRPESTTQKRSLPSAGVSSSSSSAAEEEKEPIHEPTRRSAKRSREIPRKTVPTPEKVEHDHQQQQQQAKKKKEEEEGGEADVEPLLSEESTSPTDSSPRFLGPELKEPTKTELVAIQRRQLLQRVDHYDLSDITTLSALLSNWPESDLRAMPSTNPQLPIPASQRIWISEDSSRSRSTVNGDGAEETSVLPAKRIGQIPHPPASPRSVGEHKGVTEADEGQPRELDSFCVASFTLPTAQFRKDKPAEERAMSDECDRLIREVTAINPDVFCVKQARADYASSRLRPDLLSQGYQCSRCTDGDGGRSSSSDSFKSFIFYNQDVFTEVSFHRLPVQSMARKLVSQSAYPQPWRDCLSQSLSACPGDTADPPELLVSVLRHAATGSVLLMGCLTDRVHLNNFLTSTRAPSLPLSPKVQSIPYVLGPGGSSTVTVSVAGCRSSVCGTSSSSGSEWCPPSFDSRPDLATINATGTLWALMEVWEKVQESAVSQNGPQAVPAERPLLNGFSGNEHSLPSTTPSPMRWVLCANLEASPTSPVYQIFRDGYPSDESITRLRAVRNVHLKDHDFLDSSSLIDLLWHAFQHPCTDVRSCYQSVMGSEPPFSRYAQHQSQDAVSSGPPQLVPRKCIDYIFCSGSSLHPKEVLVPPCRTMIVAASAGASHHHRLSATPFPLATETAMSLATKIGIMA